MRRHRPAAWAASILLAGGAVLSGSQSVLANHLNYVEPTEYEIELGLVRPEPTPEEEPVEEVAPAFPDAGLAEAMAAIRWCESGDDYGANTGNGYYGAYQFHPRTWQSLGYAGLPHLAPPEIQDEAARRLQARSGWGQWPACSRRLGLR